MKTLLSKRFFDFELFIADGLDKAKSECLATHLIEAESTWGEDNFNLKFPLIFWIKWRKGESKQRDEGFCECLNVDMHVK